MAGKKGMTMGGLILSIDQGTTSTRTLVFDAKRQVVASAQREFAQHYPADGWVEHDAGEIWRDTLATAREAMAQAGGDIDAIGITNQRETVVLWDRATGEPVHRAIVWQDRRTAGICAQLHAAGHEALARPVFFGDEAGLAARHGAARARAGGAGRVGFWHDRLFLAVAIDAGARA